MKEAISTLPGTVIRCWGAPLTRASRSAEDTNSSRVAISNSRPLPGSLGKLGMPGSSPPNEPPSPAAKIQQSIEIWNRKMKSIIFGLVVMLSFLSVGFGAYCSGAPDAGERTNNFPIYDAPLRFVRSVKNAMLFEAGPPNATFPVVHLWGTPYEVGYAQGELLKPVLKEFVYKTWYYMSSELVAALSGPVLPQWAKRALVQKTLDRSLDWTAEMTANFTSQSYYDEVRGLADATGISYDLIYRLNMFPELTKAQCSFFGAWENAVGNTGHSYQLRALDFDTVGPFKDFPQVTIYHPSEGHAFASVGWPGTIGVLSGFSDQQLAISEIGVYFADDSFGQGTFPEGNTPPEKVKGEPWMYVLRDVLQYSDSLESGIQRITDSNRTCNLIIGLGDGEEGMVNGIEYSGYVAVPYNDETLLPVNDTWHPKIDDVVYNAMDWDCPGYNEVMSEQLNKYHGSISEVNTIANILPTVQTGDLHAVVYDLTESKMHVSFARRAAADPSEPQYAYERQFTRLDMKAIFAQQQPVV